MSDKWTDIGSLPLSNEEAQRRKAEILDAGGVAIDLYGDGVTITLSEEARERVAQKAAALGLDVDTFMRQVLETFRPKQPPGKGRKKPRR